MFSLEKCKEIRHFVFDVDGVFTDGKFLVSESGELLRTMNARDGLAVKLALSMGYDIVIITGGKSQGVKKRFADLGVKEVYLDIQDKESLLDELFKEKKWEPKNVLYMGDDLPDIPCILMAGIGTCPADATDEVLTAADFISPVKGGRACVRDMIERILKIQDKWPLS